MVLREGGKVLRWARDIGIGERKIQYSLLDVFKTNTRMEYVVARCISYIKNDLQ